MKILKFINADECDKCCVINISEGLQAFYESLSWYSFFLQLRDDVMIVVIIIAACKRASRIS